MSRNDITGHRLVTRVGTDDNYQSNYDKIFNKEKVKDRVKLGVSPSTSVEDWDCSKDPVVVTKK